MVARIGLQCQNA